MGPTKSRWQSIMLVYRPPQSTWLIVVEALSWPRDGTDMPYRIESNLGPQLRRVLGFDTNHHANSASNTAACTVPQFRICIEWRFLVLAYPVGDGQTMGFEVYPSQRTLRIFRWTVLPYYPEDGTLQSGQRVHAYSPTMFVRHIKN